MQWIIAFVVVVGLLIWGWRMEEVAESKARDFCEQVAVGDAFSDVQDTARRAGEDRLRLMTESSVLVGYTGIPPFSRHACEVRGENGKVVSKRYLLVD